MKKDTMFRVYIAATELGFATPAQISLKTGLSDSYVRKIAKHLKHAGIFTEHYIKKRTCYRAEKLTYLVMDPSENEYDEMTSYSLDESLRIRHKNFIYTCTIFPSEERLIIFILRTLGSIPKSDKLISYCMLAPPKFSKTDSVAIKGLTPVVHTDLMTAAKRMRRKYFDTMLLLFEKRLAKRDNM